MKKDLIIVGLLFCLLIQLGVSIKNSYHLTKIEKENLIVKKFAIDLDDKLNNYADMILSLNLELDKNINELNEYKNLEQLKKDIR